MRFSAGCIVVLLVMTATIAVAQEWEVGASAGFGFPRNPTVTTPTGSGRAGFKNGLAFGAMLGDDHYNHVSGEWRYVYRVSNLKVTGGGQEAAFSGETHVFHYDVLVHTSGRKARVRPFLAGGVGLKVYRGTGTERAYQPASKFALLSKTQELRPLVSAGGGVKVALTGSLLLRLEFRDYMTPFPTEVVAPAPGASIKGWLHDFVPTVGISYKF